MADQDHRMINSDRLISSWLMSIRMDVWKGEAYPLDSHFVLSDEVFFFNLHKPLHFRYLNVVSKRELFFEIRK